MPSAADRWALELGGWGIPEPILAAAPESPWAFPAELFQADPEPVGDVPGGSPDSPSVRLAREALPVGGSVLDVGCGGGRGALGLSPTAGRVIGVDRNAELLADFAAAAEARGLDHQEILGSWPEVAASTPAADVVVCHHVVFNVPQLPSFALALHEHAARRVVLELPQVHPLAYLAPLWQRFWGITRPVGPTADDALAVLREAGLPARSERWLGPAPDRLTGLPWPRQVEITRVRLCLPAHRQEEVADALRAHPMPPERPLVTIWWDR